MSTESSNSDNIRNASRNTNTKDIKKVFVLGDSLVKHAHRWDITKKNVYVRQFSGSKVDCMKNYMKPCIRENNLDHLLFHAGPNDVPSNKKAKSIAGSIVSLAEEVKASKFDVSISSISLVMIIGTTR